LVPRGKLKERSNSKKYNNNIFQVGSLKQIWFLCDSAVCSEFRGGGSPLLRGAKSQGR
jgi:hypothetical protein